MKIKFHCQEFTVNDNAVGLVNAKHGNFMFYNYDEYVGLSIREYGEWSEKLLQKILLLINESDYVIDIISECWFNDNTNSKKDWI